LNTKLNKSLNKLKRHAHTSNAVNSDETVRILVVRYKSIADVILTSVLCNTLKKTFPNAKVDYLIHDDSESIFDEHSHINRVFAISLKQRKNPLSYFRAVSKIAARGYDLIVDAQSTQKSEFVSMLSPKSSIRIGRVKKGRGLFYTHKVDVDSQVGHKIEERLALLGPLIEMGIEVKPSHDMAITVPAAIKADFHQRMINAGIDFTRPVFVFSVTAKRNFKKWRTDHIAEVAEHCLRCFNAQIVLNYGSESELEDVQGFHEKMQGNPNICTGVQTDDLMQLAALISNCQLYIGNEGGPRHVAHAVGVPSVSVFSPSTKKAEWLPSNSRAHQGVEWDDLVDKSKEEQADIHKNLEIDSEQYLELYNMITAQPVVELVDDVADFVGILRVN
jgi:heptosyltransferase-2